MCAALPCRYAIAIVLSLTVFASSELGGQEVIDYTALGEPGFAQRVGLTDQQISQVATILDDRRNAIVVASPDARAEIFAEANRKLAALLSDQQRQAFADMVAGDKLRFSFRGESWPEVLGWFADQAGLSLIMNDAPAGSFTYSDTKSHSPAEAIDLLNSVLQSRGYTLVRREKMLIVLNITEGIPYDMVPKVSTEELSQRGRFEYVSVLLPLDGRPVESVTGEVTAFLGTHGKASPLPATGQLMVIDTAGRVDAIRKLIETIPKPKPQASAEEKAKPKPPPPVFEVHSARGLDVGSAIDTLKSLYGDARFSGDAKAEQITAYTAADKQAAIRKTLAQMQANVTGENKPRLEIYPVPGEQLEQLRDVLAQAAPGVQISKDPAQNRLLVLGDEQQQQGVRTTLEKLDALETDAFDVSVAVYDVDPQLAAQLVQLLEPLIPRASVVRNEGRIAVRGSQRDQFIAKNAIEQLEAAEENSEQPTLHFHSLARRLDGQYLNSIKQLVPKARISEVPGRNQLAIVATETEFQRVVEALQRVEAELDQQKDTAMHRMDVTVNDPDRLLSMLKQQFPATRMLLNEPRDSLLVWATAEELPDLQRHFDQYTAMLPARRRPEWKRYPASDMDLADMEALLKPIVPAAQLKPDPERRRMLVWATAEEHQKIGSTLATLHGSDTGEFAKVLIGYPIQRGDAATVVQMLEELRPDLRFVADQRANKVLVTAPLAEQQRIQAIIEQLDTEPGQGNEEVARSYAIKRLPPSTVLQLLQPTVPKMRLNPDDASQQLAAVGSAFDHRRLQQAIEQLDGAGSNGRVQAYTVGSTDLQAARNVLLQLVPTATISVNEARRSLVIWADELDHETVSQAIEQFRQPAAESESTKVYPIDRTKSPVETVISALDEDLTDRFSIQVNAESNSLVARGSVADHAELQQAIDAIVAQMPPIPKRITKVYKLSHADADRAEYILRGLLPDARITEDDQTSTLAILALPEEHRQAAEVIEQLDIPGQPNQRITEIYRFDRTSARSAENVFERLAPRARVSSIYGTNAIIATATETDHALFREAATKINGGDSESVVRVYPLDKQQIDIEDVVASIDDTLKSRVAVRINEATNSLIVRGSDEDQATMKQLIDEIIAQVPPLKRREAKVYRFQHGSARSARQVLRDMFDDAVISYDEDTETLVATASTEDQRRIASIVEQMDQPNASSKSTQVYRLEVGLARRVYSVISELVQDGRVSYDNDSNIVIVTTTAPEHERVQQAIQDLNDFSSDDATRVYTLKSANPANIQDSLERLMPQVRVASDNASGTLIVSAEDDDQQRVAKLVEQLDAVPGQDVVMKAYVISSLDAKQIHQSLANTFQGNGNYSISFQEATKTLFVIATPKNHAIFADLLREMDSPALAESNRTAKNYPLTNMSAASARTAITALLQGSSPPAAVELDEFANSLIVVGTDQQHRRVAGTLGQLKGTDSELEVFDLDYTDPWTVENAIGSLFANQPESAKPSVSSDFASQRLFVRGSRAQIDQVRTLLQKLGETSLAVRGASSGGRDVRTIPFRGDVQAAIEQIQAVWPRIRKNRIQVVAPSDPTIHLPRGSQQNMPLRLDDDADNGVRSQPPIEHLRYVALQTTTRAPEAAAESQVDDAASKDNAKPPETGNDQPVVIVPEEDRITIASTDHEALDRLEALFRAMARSESMESGMGADFAVFLLRNTGASEMQGLLGELFEQLRKNKSPTSTGPNNPGFAMFGPDFGSVAVVADDRLNALIVHGDRKERELIEQLLRVLDSEDLPNPIIVYQPELVRLENTQAQRILGILTNVYKAQLTSGGGRKKIDIPEGVDSEVASVLQQINAAAAAPLLTLGVDETTNSIVMRAPPELRQELKTFIATLDEGAATNRSRNVRVIRLSDGKSEQIREALEQFIWSRSSSSSPGN